MDALPEAVEKRLVLRMLNVWRQACTGECYPSHAELMAHRVDDIWQHSFRLDLFGPGGRPVFLEAGAGFASHADVALEGLPADQAPADTLVAHALCCLDAVRKIRAPVSHGGRFRDRQGREVLFRTILLPLSDDGRSMTGLIGAANCRFVTADDARAA